ncbi:hypothetical protein KVR01_006541 [Diaporthe batatas]|uniref:uncharacterized protein n=1 Tax=Diaporthe batatas TaxID=748121 RepID=UPI001D05936C|nr:uncharacterized protein KVR01_006541 [Diaporthe batatas]KAG8163244.1 hypothetical protein KVR01_006541 [Diaporthe batatas]
MGSGASKSAAQSTIRKFPNRAPGSAVPPPSSTSHAPRTAASSRPPPRKKAQAPQASLAKNEAILRDGSDPHMSSPPENSLQPGLAERLRQIGVVQPNPTYSPSSTASPTTTTSSPHEPYGGGAGGAGGPVFPSPSNNLVLLALEARARLSREAEEEFEGLGVSGGQGRRFLTSGMIRDVLVMREQGARDEDIEHRFNLRKGVISRLGPRHMVQPLGGPAP